MIFDSKEDGISHINIYSKGKTELGRFLSNFTYFPLKVDEGEFCSVEGYWYYLNCTSNNPRKEELRELTGFEAKKIGREILTLNIGVSYLFEDWFENKIKKAIRYKIENSSFLKEFNESTLPFAHYYVVYGKFKDAGYKWIVEFHEELRKELKCSA